MSDIKKYIETKEYIVTLKDFNDLDSFYNEIETSGIGSKSIPNRDVRCIERRPNSRNTTYLLAEWEAEELRLDPRVEHVKLHPKYLGITAGEFSTKRQTSANWNKSSSTSNNMLNFGLLRCTEGQDRDGWGSDGTTNATGTVTLDSTGKNVDVVIIDGNKIVIGHPEYAVNADGSGGTRFNQYNWYQHNPSVTGGAAGTYVYTGSVSDHATHVAATTAGSTQGWARDANIYNIYYFAGADNDVTFPYVMDYVREFHRTKSVNPAIGRKNPTITNNSWGMSIFPSEWSFSDITAVTYRGTRYTPSGDVTYTGISGVYDSSTLLSTLNGFENFGNRISTTGPYSPPGGDFLTTPPSWTIEGNQVYLANFNAPDNQYEITLQGPADISLIHNVAAEAFAGTLSISGTVQIFEGSNTVPDFEYSEGPYTGIDGSGIEIDIRQNNINLNNNSVYTIRFNTNLDISSTQSPTVAVAMSLTIASESQSASATVTSIPNSLLGAASLTPSTTPTSGNTDDGYWTISLPFNIEYLGNSYSTVYIGTNFYTTFGAGSVIYSGISASSPNLPKIMWGAADNSAQRIYYGVEDADSAIYTVTNSGSSSYTINSSSNPTLTLKRGGTYTFNVDASGHPFWIKTSQVTGTGDAYNTGVTNNGTDSGTITFTVPENAPSTLYYICQFHGSMTGTINVVAGTRTYRVRLEGNASTSGTLGNPGMVCEYVFYEATPNQIDLQLGITNRKNLSGGFSTQQLNDWGFVSGARIPARVEALDSDIIDAMNEGILYVGAAGNGSWKHDLPGGIDWDNTFEMGIRYPDSITNPYYYMRGSSPTANDINMPNISVGSIDSVVGDRKATYSDCGPGVDIYAPGTNVISADISGASDSRSGGTTYYFGKKSGTSMASPQVCGVLACALEQNPNWNQVQAKEYLLSIAKENQIIATTGGPADLRDLQGSENLYLYYQRTRPDQGITVPKLAQGKRPTSGLAWPRPKIYRFGSSS